MKSTNEAKFNWWWLIGILVIAIWIFFPFLFNKLMFWMTLNGGSVNTFASLGPIGDIYGSLNTLFTSATLAIVVYSTLLQRQANQDAKDAMAQQLQQARDATAQQLIQARKALDLQLAQAKDSTTQQLALAQASHNAQIKESQYAIFSNMFNNLLTHKNELKHDLSFQEKGITYNHEHIFGVMEKKFDEKIESYKIKLDEIDNDLLLDDFFNSAKQLGLETTSQQALLITYFKIYESILDLIKFSILTQSEKAFYYQLVGNTMSLSEQVCLLWISAGFEHIREHLQDTHIFWFNLNTYIDVISKFHTKSCFGNDLFLEKWDEFEKKQTPT